MFAKHNPTYFTFDVKCCEKSFYHTNYGVIQGFPALRKAVTTHLEKYFFPIMLHNLVKTQRFKQTNFNSVTKCTAVRGFHRISTERLYVSFRIRANISSLRKRNQVNEFKAVKMYFK